MLLSIVFWSCLLVSEVSSGVSDNILEDKDSLDFPPVWSSLEGRKFRCGDDQCWCYGDTADCSRHDKLQLTYVPGGFPSNITFLNFSYNNLNSIDENFFSNVSDFTGMDLGRNPLSNISEKAFKHLHRLKYLFMDYSNQLTYQALDPVFSIDSLSYLGLRHGRLGTLPADLFYRHPMPNLTTLYLHENHLGELNMSALVPLKRLKKLGVAGNQITKVYPDRLAMLTTLNLDSNLLADFPETCRKSGTDFSGGGRARDSALFPRLEKLYLQDNRIGLIPEDVCLPKLELLNIHGNKFTRLPSHNFSQAKFPQLKSLYVGRMRSDIRGISAEAFSNPSIVSLSLMFNQLNFSTPNVTDPAAFRGLPKLQTLQLSDNVLDLTTELFVELFGGLFSLQTLYLGNCRIRQLSAAMFDKLTSLKKLFLYQNTISVIPDGTFNAVKNLTWLNLRTNQITLITETTFSKHLRASLKHLDLSDNPFTCSCDLRWFQSWLKDSTVFRKSRSTYSCHNIPGTRVQDLLLTDQVCLMSRAAYVFTMVIVAMLIFTVTVGLMLYRYRWYIRLLLYEASRGQSNTRFRRLQEQHFDYDVFVSYASEDESWVQKYLIPELEGRQGLKLCTHERDFIPGKNIIENIQDCLEGSRKVMTLFSPHFARSQWCQTELAICMTHVIDYDDALVIVRLRELRSRDMTSAMLAVVKTTTYIEWEDSPEAVVCFWGRIRIALREILSLPRKV